MNAMLTEDELSRALSAAAQDIPVPSYDGVLAALVEAPVRRPAWRRRRVQLAVVAGIAAAGVGVLALAGGTVSTQQRTEVAGGAPAVGRAHADVPLGTPTDAFSGAGGVVTRDGEALVPAPQPLTAQAPRTSAGVVPPAAAPVTAALPDGGDSRVVKTGTITLVAADGDVTKTVDAVTQFATTAKGYVAGATSTEYGDSPSATVTLRVPVAAFEGVVRQVRGVGAKVVSAETSGKDVTATYADTEAQIASLRAARARFLTILAGARTIGETLTVQQRVDDVQARIDRLEGQRRVLASQSDLATLTVTVSEKVELAGKTTSPSGLSAAWDDAKHGFTSGVEGLVARSGRALLVLLVGAVALLVLRLGWRLARRRLV